MTRPKLHTVPVMFTQRIEKRLNDYLAEWAKSEGVSKGLLIEQLLGRAALKREMELDSK